MSILFLLPVEKKNAYMVKRDQFSCLPFLLTGPDILALTTTKYVCLIGLQPGNCLFCCFKMKVIFMILYGIFSP